ncbi:amidohydrolase family protein [Spirillospora sp. NBC_01491]|uniref:amidohydrolase family protein n=1 Tax=Spirillospora sp. NBC_01491 TaxID=2976007 RepID=UPI002E311EDC|nr:amidohydrolase family protein [Spirillospora sp. NBC_01491]
MRTVIDVNRILGPIPTGEVPSADAPGLIAELDRLRIDRACAVHAHALYYDPVSAHGASQHGASSHGDAQPAGTADAGRLVHVPVLVPGPLGTGAGTGRLVRLCPAEHRFALAGPHGLALAGEVADRGGGVLLGWESAPAADVHRLAARLPRLPIVLINTGYRSLRELADLMDAHPRIGVDTATLSGHLSVEWLARRYGPHRVLFGTGAPVSDDAGPRFQLDLLDLPEADVDLIAGGNARALLGLADEEWTA